MTAASADGGMPCVDLKYESLRHLQEELGPFLATEGFFLRDEVNFQPSDVLRFRVMLPGEFILVEGVGVVIWVRRPEDSGVLDPPGAAVGFATLSEQGRELVERMAQTHLEKGGKPFDLSRPSAGGEQPKEEIAVSAPDDETVHSGFKFQIRGGDESSQAAAESPAGVVIDSGGEIAKTDMELELDESDPKTIPPVDSLPTPEAVDPNELTHAQLMLDDEEHSAPVDEAPEVEPIPDDEPILDEGAVDAQPDAAQEEALASHEASFWVESEAEVDGADTVKGAPDEEQPATAIQPPPELPEPQQVEAMPVDPPPPVALPADEEPERDEAESVTAASSLEPEVVPEPEPAPEPVEDRAIAPSKKAPSTPFSMELRTNDDDDSGVFREEEPEDSAADWGIEGESGSPKGRGLWLVGALVVLLIAAGWFFWPQLQGLIGADDPGETSVVGGPEAVTVDPGPIGDEELEAAVIAAVEALSKSEEAEVAVEPTKVPPKPTSRPARVESSASATAVQDISSSQGTASTTINIAANGKVDESQLVVDQLSSPPRVLVRIRGITRPYRPYEVNVDTEFVNRLRIGHHPETSPPSLWVVIDMVSPAVRLQDARVSGSTILISVGR